MRVSLAVCPVSWDAILKAFAYASMVILVALPEASFMMKVDWA
jgi:hypothetical protein